MTYLGTVLSYESYEDQTLQHRLGIAELQRSRSVVAYLYLVVHVGGDNNQTVLQQVRLEFPGEMLLLQINALIARVGVELGGHCQRYHEDGAPLEAMVSGRRSKHTLGNNMTTLYRICQGLSFVIDMVQMACLFACTVTVYWLKRQEAGLSPDQPDEQAPLTAADQVQANGTNLPLARRDQVRGSRCIHLSALLSGKLVYLGISLQMALMDIEGAPQQEPQQSVQIESAKRKPQNQGARPTGKGKGRGRQRGSGTDQNQGRQAQNNQHNNQPELLDLLIKLVLRHEAFLGRLQQDMVYIFTFKNQPNAPDSLLPVLYQ
ncbi:unnamed protein product, partial [Symbiodinium necroappetens]